LTTVKNFMGKKFWQCEKDVKKYEKDVKKYEKDKRLENYEEKSLQNWESPY